MDRARLLSGWTPRDQNDLRHQLWHCQSVRQVLRTERTGKTTKVINTYNRERLEEITAQI